MLPGSRVDRFYLCNQHSIVTLIKPPLGWLKAPRSGVKSKGEGGSKIRKQKVTRALFVDKITITEGNFAQSKKPSSTSSGWRTSHLLQKLELSIKSSCHQENKTKGNLLLKVISQNVGRVMDDRTRHLIFTTLPRFSTGLYTTP